MPLTRSIKNAPDAMVRCLKERARRHHRSLQGEPMAILEAAVLDVGPLSPQPVLAETRRIGVKTPREAAALIRADRDW